MWKDRDEENLPLDNETGLPAARVHTELPELHTAWLAAQNHSSSGRSFFHYLSFRDSRFKVLFFTNIDG